MSFATARAAAADHFRRRWATFEPGYDNTCSELFIHDDDRNIYPLLPIDEGALPPELEDTMIGVWLMYGSFDGTITCTVKQKKDGSYWCPATNLIRLRPTTPTTSSLER